MSEHMKRLREIAEVAVEHRTPIVMDAKVVQALLDAVHAAGQLFKRRYRSGGPIPEGLIAVEDDAFSDLNKALASLYSLEGDKTQGHENTWARTAGMLSTEPGAYEALSREAERRVREIASGETTTSQCCRDNVPPAGGLHQEDERWSCPECRTQWVHVIEESEGAWWIRATEMCICGAALEDGKCHSDHHMDFAVKEGEAPCDGLGAHSLCPPDICIAPGKP